MEIHIRKAKDSDQDAVWKIIEQVILPGDTYVYDPGSSREKMVNIWFSKDRYTYVAEIDGIVVGTFWMKTNQMDLGSHIVNAAYMVDPNLQGKGIGLRLALFSMEEAKKLGYRAMQFNLVVNTNTHAIALWEKLGFQIIGEIPEAFEHAEEGLVGAYVMYKKL